MLSVSRSSRSSEAHALPTAGYSPLLTSMSLQSHSSLNAALENASSAVESIQAGGGEEEGVSELQGLEDAQQQPSHVNENGWKRGEDGMTVNGSKGQHFHGDIEGLSTQLSTMGSIPMEDLSGGDEGASSSDCEPFEADELQLIEDALRSLRSVEEGKIEAFKGVEHNFSSSNDLQDVARLLKKVQAVKARNKGAPLKHLSSIPSRSLGQGSPVGEDLEPAEVRQVVQAAAQTALAAAKTAETVVSSLNRNSQAMEELCKALNRSNSVQVPSKDTVNEQEEDEEGESKFLAIELQQTEIAKSLVRQNRMTHWVLGFIVASSLVWRYGVVKFVKRVNNTIQNPFQGITDIFRGKDHSDRDHNGLQLKLPGIMTGQEEAEGKPRAEKEKEKKRFDFSRIFPGQEPQEKKEDGPFDLRSIGSNLPGHDRDSG